MTPQQIEVLKQALAYIDAVPDDRYNAEHIDRDALIAAIKEALAEHAMRETQRLGQEIEQEPVVYQCPRCATSMQVDLTAKAALAQPEQEPVAWQWLGSAHFRKKLPKNADITAWNPLYTTPPQENT